MGTGGAGAFGDHTKETKIRERLATKNLGASLLGRPETAAYELCRWTAEWVGEGDRSRVGNAGGVYWPPMKEDVGLAPAPRKPGTLTAVSANDVSATLESFIDHDLVTQSGWPDPVAAADYFEAAVKRGQSTAMRQLELLLAGTVSGDIELRETKRRDGREVSLDQIIEDHREVSPDLARYALHPRGDDDAVLGFTAPHTLLCPAPDLPESVWSDLWRSVTGRPAAEWARRDSSWGSATLLVDRIRAWIRACERRHPNATPPPWARVFRSQPPASTESGFGAGAPLTVRWGEEFVDVFLPTPKPGDLGRDAAGRFPEGDRKAFLDQHGTVVGADGERLFWLTSFECPDLGQVHGIWRGHLEHLQANGEIELFGSDSAERQVYVVTWSENARTYECVTLPRTELLDRATIAVGKCTPMKQVGVPGGEVTHEILYPHYPLRPAYLDLVKHAGRSLVEHLKEGRPPKGPQPTIRPRRSGDQAVWSLRLRGRGDAVNFTLPVPPEDSFHKAHWMVWPGFQSPGWRAYYTYQHCTDPRLRVDTLWLREGADEAPLQMSHAPDERPYPVAFDPKRGRHEGGPPAAFSARRGEEELGIYLVGLKPVSECVSPMGVGIDFGTSHTAAAVQLGDRNPSHIDLKSELIESTKTRLSLHISQNMDHVTASRDDVGLLSQGTWFPSYVDRAADHLKGLWPSELLTIPPVEKLGGSVRDWQPIRDYVIPPAGVRRTDLANHVIANFKWNMSDRFHGKEAYLRQIYLDRILEQVLAEALQRYGRPSDAIQFTFTYPLRTPKPDVRGIREDSTGGAGSRGGGSRLSAGAAWRCGPVRRVPRR